MRITESNMWAQVRLDEPSNPARVEDVPPVPEGAVISAANELDSNRDGWLDEDDVPYDQLLRLERKAEADAEVGAYQQDPAEATRPASETRPAAVELKQQDGAGGAPQIDLLA